MMLINIVKRGVSTKNIIKRGYKTPRTTTKFELEEPVAQGDAKSREMYRIMDERGKLVAEKSPCESAAEAEELYKQMVVVNEMDKLGYDVQRQGRISFYMTQFGEEAESIGAGHCLSKEDVIYAQYREGGLLLVRGWSLDQFMNQLYSNELDIGKGRQMPMHFGSKELNFHTISSPLTTQQIGRAHV